MIVRLRGILETLDGNVAMVTPRGAADHDHSASSTAGLSYEVLLPAYLAQRLLAAGNIGQPVTLHTLQYLEAVGQGTSFIPRLLGFATPREREFFNLFTTVKGLGNKRALRALAIEPGRIAAAIVARDAKALSQLPEIGKRLAETVIAELSGKVTGFADPAHAASARAGSMVEPLNGTFAAAAAAGGGFLPPMLEEAVSALMNLGENRAEAERLVARAVQRSPGLSTTEEVLAGALAGR